MAARVNTRFVIILIVSVIALLGLLILAYSVAVKSASDLAKAGDVLMEQGEYKLAEKAYSKAVNKDSTNSENLEKWIDSLEHILPETETEFRGKYNTDYKSALQATATILRNDIDAHERILKLEFLTLEENFSRARADHVITITTNALGFFNDMGGEPQEWERLKRYRGISIYMIAVRDGLLDDDQYILAADDLDRASQADPSDTQSATAMITMRSLIATKDLREDDEEGHLNATLESLELANAYLSKHPNSIAMTIQKLFAEITLDRKKLAIEYSGSDDTQAKTDAIADLNAQYEIRINSIGDSLASTDRDQLSVENLRKFYSLESSMIPDSMMSKTRQLVDLMIETSPDDASLLMIAGKISKDVGDHDEAIGWYARIGDLKPKPLGYEGLRQYDLQKSALLAQASIRADQALATLRGDDEEAIERAIELADSSRANYASNTKEDDLQLIMLEGKAEHARKNYEQALLLFKKYNEQTKRQIPEGLWQEGTIAMQLGQYGIARTAMSELILIDNSSRRILAMVSIAQIDERLKDFDSAAQIYTDILDFVPTYELAQQGLERMNLRLNPDLNDDPELAAVYTSRQMRQGNEENPADYAGAIEYLREAVERLDYGPIVSQELVSMLLDNQDIEGARKILSLAKERSPDDEQLNRMISAVSSSDTTEILVNMIQLSDRDELDKLLSIARIAIDRNRKALLDPTVQSLNQLDPNNRNVLEITFVHSIKYGDGSVAKSIAQRTDISRNDALSFRARVAASDGKFDESVELLKQSIASGSADASTHQMIANFQRQLGQLPDAIASYEQSLSIRPDNASVITDYVLTLVQMGREEDALSTARRLQRYGTQNTTFMSLWLNLEANFGGTQGRDFAIRQRERMLELNPNDIENKFQLARMYVLSKNWESSRTLIDELRASNDQLVFVELDAMWFANQGVINNQDAVMLANNVYAQYIQSLPQPVGPEAYISNSEFMLGRGRPDLAIAAANSAVEHQSSDTMLGSKLLGNIYSRINNLSSAVDAYQAVIDNNADPDFSIHYLLVETLTRLGRFDDASDIYTSLPEDLTKSMVSLILKSDIESGRGNKIEASRILDEAVSQYPNNSYTFIKRAESMLGDEEQFDDMLSDIARAIDINPNDWRAYRVRAAGYLTLGRTDEAINDLRSTIRINPRLDKSIFSMLNEMLNTPGGAGEALDEARAIIAMRPDDATLMSRIGSLFSSRDDWKRASEIYKLAWDKRQSVNDGAIYIDSLVRKSPPDARAANAVIESLARMVGNINESPGLLAAQALVLQARGREDFAFQQLTKAFDLSMHKDADLMTWSTNVSRYFETENAQKQVEYLEAINRRNTLPQISAWIDLFIAQALIGDEPLNERAIDIFNQLHEYSQNPLIQVQSFQLHGTTLYNEKQYEQAAQVWENGLKLFSDDWQMNNNVAYLFSTELDRLEDSIEYGQRAIDKNFARSEAYETMARIYIKLKKFDEAEQMIKDGSGYLRGVRPRVTMLITSSRLDLAKGNLVEARSKLNDAKAVLRSSSKAIPELEEDIEEYEQELDSAQG